MLRQIGRGVGAVRELPLLMIVVLFPCSDQLSNGYVILRDLIPSQLAQSPRHISRCAGVLAHSV